MSFVIKLDNGYVRWSHIGGYTIVINPELATTYASKSAAMVGRPWSKTNKGDFQIGEVISHNFSNGGDQWESGFRSSCQHKSEFFSGRLWMAL